MMIGDLPHSLRENGESSGLIDDNINPLDDNYRNKVRALGYGQQLVNSNKSLQKMPYSHLMQIPSSFQVRKI